MKVETENHGHKVVLTSLAEVAAAGLAVSEAIFTGQIEPESGYALRNHLWDAEITPRFECLGLNTTDSELVLSSLTSLTRTLRFGSDRSETLEANVKEAQSMVDFVASRV